MDIPARARALSRVTSECLRLVRAAAKVSAQDADRLLKDLPASMREWSREIESAPADSAVREIPGYDGYSLWAGSYDDDPDNRVIIGEERFIWDLIGPAAGKRILDVGCGTGRHAIPLAALGARVVACEPNQTLLAMAKSKEKVPGPRIEWLPCDIDALPADIGRFDVVLCCLVLSHVADIDAALARLSRHVADDGCLVVTDFHPFNLLIGWRTSFVHEGAKYVVPNFLHLPSHYFEAFQRAGLEVESFKEVGDFPRLPDQPATILIKGRRARGHRQGEQR